MIKNPQLLNKFRKKENRLEGSQSFAEKVRRYEGMYELARKLNPKIAKWKNVKHLEHLIRLTGSFRRISEEL